MARIWQLEQEQVVPWPRSEVFSFFADAQNLERLTPGFLGFKILTPGPIQMGEGTLIDYRLSLYGIPLDWRTRIERFEPERIFVDTQLSGPYRSWTHTHTFEEVSGGTLVKDHVSYELPLGILGEAARALFVRRSLERIFAHRRAAIGEFFSGETGN